LQQEVKTVHITMVNVDWVFF